MRRGHEGPALSYSAENRAAEMLLKSWTAQKGRVGQGPTVVGWTCRRWRAPGRGHQDHLQQLVFLTRREWSSDWNKYSKEEENVPLGQFSTVLGGSMETSLWQELCRLRVTTATRENEAGPLRSPHTGQSQAQKARGRREMNFRSLKCDGTGSLACSGWGCLHPLQGERDHPWSHLETAGTGYHSRSSQWAIPRNRVYVHVFDFLRCLAQTD